jgi:hypothetical protein
MQQRKTMIHRRRLLHAVTVGAAVAVAGGASLAPATAAPDTKFGKRKAQYQPDSVEVRNFYRVNRYPAN